MCAMEYDFDSGADAFNLSCHGAQCCDMVSSATRVTMWLNVELTSVFFFFADGASSIPD